MTAMSRTLPVVPAATPAAIEPIPFGALLRAELRKTTSVRAARWLLAGTAALAVAAEAIPLIFTHDVSQTRASFLTWSALGVSRLLPIVLLMAMTSEWSQRTAMTTFALEPRRGRVLTAKALAGLCVAAAAGVFSFAVATITVLAAAHPGHHHIGTGWDWAELGGFAVFVIATSAIGIAVGAAVQNTAAAIVTYFALAAAFSILMVPALEKVGDWVNTAQTFGWLLDGQFHGHTAQIAVSAAVWIALPLAIGTVRTLRRDVA